MTWSELEFKVPQEDENTKVLRREIAQSLDRSPVFTKFLRTVLQSATFAKGRDLPDVTFSEGQRALARQILQLGGKFDE